MMLDAVRLAVTLGALYALHQVADHWIQTHKQATGKANRGSAGAWPCLRHVATYTATLGGGLAALALLYPALGYSAPAVVGGLALNAATHYVADRRMPLRALAVATGKRAYWDDVPGGAYQLDQAWHYGWLLVSALIIAA